MPTQSIWHWRLGVAPLERVFSDNLLKLYNFYSPDVFFFWNDNLIFSCNWNQRKLANSNATMKKHQFTVTTCLFPLLGSQCHAHDAWFCLCFQINWEKTVHSHRHRLSPSWMYWIDKLCTTQSWMLYCFGCSAFICAWIIPIKLTAAAIVAIKYPKRKHFQYAIRIDSFSKWTISSSELRSLWILYLSLICLTDFWQNCRPFLVLSFDILIFKLWT